MKRYPKYKDSGIQWLGQIPEHWETRKIAELFTERREKVSDKDYPALSVSKAGITPQLETAVKTDNGDNRKKVCEGDFVVNSRSDRKGSCGVSPYTGSVSLINTVLQPRTELNRSYMHYLLRSNDYIEEYYRLGRGIVADLWTTRYSEAKNIYIPFPPIAEQEKIVAFIDTKTNQIDGFISEREKQLQALSELRQTIIAEAVTRGLNPDVPMKESGIDWAGNIPSHWDTIRIGSLFTDDILNNSDFRFQHAYKFYYGTLVPKNEIGDESEYRDTYIKYSVLQKDDIVINGLNLNYDFVSQRVAIAPEEGIITSAYLVLRPRPTTFAEYYLYVLKTMDNKKMFHGMGTGIRLTLSFGELKKQALPKPPIEEQRAIVEYIDTKCKHINDTIAQIESEITHLKEYKQRLIADAVTGAINVQE